MGDGGGTERGRNAETAIGNHTILFHPNQEEDALRKTLPQG
jgi:hypothetical protein